MSGLGRIAVLMGGSSAEREISLISGRAVLAGLLSKGVDAFAFDPSERPLEDLHRDGVARVFVILHGRGGEDGTLQGALDWLKIPYTGSGVLASALAMDKWRCKLVWESLGLPIPEFEIVEAQSDFSAIAARLGLPLFVKPANEGSSIGITKVKNIQQFAEAYALASRFDSCVIAERCLAGGEFTVGIIGDQILPPIRIVPATEFYDYEAKYTRDDTQYLIPCGLPPAEASSMQDLARKAFVALGGRGWGRVDFLRDVDGRIACLEANTAPGMTSHSLVPMAARAVGIEFPDLVLQILEGARCG